MDCFSWLDFKRRITLFLVLFSVFSAFFYGPVSGFIDVLAVKIFWLIALFFAALLLLKQRKKVAISFVWRAWRYYLAGFFILFFFSAFLSACCYENNKELFFLCLANFSAWTIIYVEKIYLFNHVILPPNITFTLKAGRHARLKFKITGHEKLIFYLSWCLLKTHKPSRWQKGECCLRIFSAQTNYSLYDLSGYCLLYRPVKSGGEQNNFLIEFIVLPQNCITETKKKFSHYNYRRQPQFQLKFEKHSNSA